MPNCTNCAEARQKEGMAPLEMVVVGETSKKKLTVYACPTCDGQKLIDLSSRG